MESNNNQQHITREVFDANILAIREAMAASEARCERIAAEMRIDFQAKSDEMREKYNATQTRLDNMDKRIDNMERSQDKFFRNFSIAAGVVTLLFTGLQVFIAVVTLIK